MAAPRPEDKNADTRQERASSQTQAERSSAEATNRIAKTAADVSERTARIGIEAVKRNNEAAKQAWDASTQMASRLTQQSADQFGHILGISGEDAQDVLQDTSKNLDALLGSANVMALASEEISRQWLDTARKLMEGAIGRTGSLARCRTTHDLFALQVELARENLNTMLHGNRRISEISARAAQEATAKMSERLGQAA